MSSSEEKIACAYLWGLAIIPLSALGLIILLTWVVDPLGILRDDRGFPTLCADGIKTTGDRTSIPLLPLKTDFNQAIIGTSRIKRGFTQAAFEENTPGKTINLGIGGISLKELYRFSMPLIRSEQLDTLWVGLDYGMFNIPMPAKMVIYEKKHGINNQWWSYLAGALSFTAWRETAYVLWRTKNCRTPIRDYSGFIIKGEHWNKRDNARNQKQNQPGSLEWQERRLFKKFSKIDTTQPRRYQHRLALLEKLIKEAADHSVQLNLFINPSPPGYFDILERAGKLDEYQQLQIELQRLTQKFSHTAIPPKFLDFSDWYTREDSRPLGCSDSFAPPCPFYDLTHYRPYVGQQILKAFQD